MAFGIAFSIKSALGTSPVSGVPYVLSLFTPLTVGQATIAFNCTLILLQILLLRRRFRLFQLMQLPVAFFFGFLTDVGTRALAGIGCSAYWQQWGFCLVWILLVAVAVSLEVKAGCITLAGEGMVLALCKVLPVKFGNMKVAFDVTLVVAACILSLVFTRRIQGVREGTAAAALLVGMIAKRLGRLLERWRLE